MGGFGELSGSPGQQRSLRSMCQALSWAFARSPLTRSLAWAHSALVVAALAEAAPHAGRLATVSAHTHTVHNYASRYAIPITEMLCLTDTSVLPPGEAAWTLAW